MEWISTDDRLPDKDGRVLVYDDIEKKVTIANGLPDIDGIWLGVETEPYEPYSKEALFRVTHWMPLPEKPKD